MEPRHVFVDFAVANERELNRCGYWLCSRPEYMDHLLQHMGLVHWAGLLNNPSPRALTLLQANHDKLDLGRIARGACTAWSTELLLAQDTNPELQMRVLSHAHSARALERLRENPGSINWQSLSSNPASGAVDMLLANQQKIEWPHLSSNSNPRAIALLQAHPERICWMSLARNQAPEAGEMLSKNPSNVWWGTVSQNTSPWAIALLTANLDKVVWSVVEFDGTPAMCRLYELGSPSRGHWYSVCKTLRSEDFALIEGTERLNWYALTFNPADRALDLLEANPDKIYWPYLCRNSSPRALRLLEANHRIDYHWQEMAMCSALFRLDYATMREQMAPLREELLRSRMHPSRLYEAEHHWLLF
jgi:hypothetical protein